MMNVHDFYLIISSIVPLYIFMFVGYGSVKWWKVFNQEQCFGINRFCSFYAVPVLSFYYIARTNLYEMNLQLFGADVLQKMIVLLVLACWYKLSLERSIEWFITIFSICTLPNALILGVRFIRSMYQVTAAPLIVEIFLTQSLIWHPLLLTLYEYRAARIVLCQQFSDTHGHDVDIETATTGGLGVAGGIYSTVMRVEKAEATGVADVGVGEGKDLEIHIHSKGHESSRDQPFVGNEQGKIEKVPSTSTIKVIPENENQRLSNYRPTSMPSTSVMTKHIVKIVRRKLLGNPNTYTTILGLVWAFVVSNFRVLMPLIVTRSATFLSHASLGMGMFNMGLSMGLQPTFIPCAKGFAALTMSLRFIIGPMVMAFSSLIVGLRGTRFNIAVVQAAISQGITPSVFAVEYNVYPEIFSIGMIFGMIVVLPVTLLYYNLLDIQG